VGTPGIVQFATFFFGLLFGSFLNVCIARLPRGESIVRPRSRCPQCGTPIRWYDNVPLLSWLLLRRHCRDCHTAISWQYPAVELAVGLWFAYATTLFWNAAQFPPTFGLTIVVTSVPAPTASHIAIYFLSALGLAILGFLLIGLIVMDWQTMRLPDAFTVGGIAIALFLICAQAIFLGPDEDEIHLTKHSLHLTSPGGVTDHGNLFLTGPENLIFSRVAAVCGAALLLLLIRWTYKALRHREGMGLGDVKLLAMIAAFLGFWPSVLSLFVGALAASLYGVVLLVRGRAGAASKLPFGSFLAIGGLIAALFGNRLIDIYTAFLR
jgi:leader peptidase (prepilin peptidase) / N-methyltransferase